MKKLQDSRILIVHGAPYNRKMLSGILQLMGVKNIENAFEASDALNICMDNKFDVIIAEMNNGISDAIALSKDLRKNPTSPNNITPVLAISGPGTENLVEDAREAGITDLLKNPYSADNIAERVMYAINTPAQEQIKEVSRAPRQTSAPKQETADKPTEEWPNDQESNALTNMLMEHYLRQHEIVLTKLRFTQDATKASINEIRNIHEKVKETDDAQESDLKDFSSMWEHIINMFVEGGLSEQALFDIEKIITQIPDDIKQHYDDLTSKDKDFLARMEKLNKSGYNSAKERVLNLQEEANPLTGKTAADYQEAIAQKEPEEEDSGTVKAIVYDPIQQKMIFKSYQDQ